MRGVEQDMGERAAARQERTASSWIEGPLRPAPQQTRSLAIFESNPPDTNNARSLELLRDARSKMIEVTQRYRAAAPSENEAHGPTICLDRTPCLIALFSLPSYQARQETKPKKKTPPKRGFPLSL